MKQTFCTLFAKSLTAVLVILFTACTHKNADQISAQIDFWSFPNFTSETGVPGDFEKSLIEAFEKENPSIKVHFTLLNFTDGPAQIEKAISSGKTPDIIYDAPGRIILWANQGLLEPLDDVLATEKPYITFGPQLERCRIRKTVNGSKTKTAERQNTRRFLLQKYGRRSGNASFFSKPIRQRKPYK